MASRAVNRIRPSAPPEDSLLGHFLDPLDRLSETLFALMILDFTPALRLSILVSFGTLFAAGWGYGHYSRMSPWKTGLVMMAAGGVLGLIALFLEK
jgi:hypothetical protein